jgi:hypothetical protein
METFHFLASGMHSTAVWSLQAAAEFMSPTNQLAVTPVIDIVLLHGPSPILHADTRKPGPGGNSAISQ